MLLHDSCLHRDPPGNWPSLTYKGLLLCIFESGTGIDVIAHLSDTPGPQPPSAPGSE